MRNSLIHPFLLLVIAYVGSLQIQAEPTEKPGRHLFVLSGQSNMNSTLSGSFQKCVEQVLGKDKVLVTMTGHPGQPIKHWVKSWIPPEGMQDPKPEANGPLYDKLIQNARRYLKDERPVSVTFIWMQGEADSENRWASVYEKSFHTLVNQIKADLGVEEIHFVVGRINDYWLQKPDGRAMREVLMKLGDENDNGAWIDTDDLNQVVNPWGGYSFNDGHYPPSGYVVMGQRFAKEACRLIQVDFTPDTAIFGETFIDSFDDIKTHAAIGKAVSGTVPDISRDGAGKGLALLTDGKFGRAKETDPAWIGFAPSATAIELIVSFDEPLNVDAIAINLLLSSSAKAEFPNKITYSHSEDGETFKNNQTRFSSTVFYSKTEIAEMRAKGIKPTTALVLRGHAFSNVRKIKIEIETGEQWVLIDEVVVNPE